MARYIDAEKLKAYLHEEDFDTPDERWKPESEFADMIDATPTEVVMCKDCKWYQMLYSGVKPYAQCCNLAGLCRKSKPTDFCSYGERRETDAEG